MTVISYESILSRLQFQQENEAYLREQARKADQAMAFMCRPRGYVRATATEEVTA